MTGETMMSIVAYHFVGATLRDGRPIPADGEWLVHEGPVEICEAGLHASLCPFDALQSAPGATLCLVECEYIVTEHAGKFVCRLRRIVKRIDATELLWSMARWSALQVINLWDAPAVVREYLETGDESKRTAAGIAASTAARAAAAAESDPEWSAANAVEWAASSIATWAASGDAASATAWDAAWAAAWAATRVAASDVHRAEFRRRVTEAFA